MKTFLLLIVAACCFISCKKNGQSPSRPTSKLFGKWELRHQVGGWGYDSTYMQGNGHVIQFNSDSTYKSLNNAAIVEQGNFRIRKYIQGPEVSSVIIFNGDVNGAYFNLDGNTLTIGSNAADGIANHYQKIQN